MVAVAVCNQAATAPLQLQLQLATLNVANALLHASLIWQADSAAYLPALASAEIARLSCSMVDRALGTGTTAAVLYSYHGNAADDADNAFGASSRRRWWEAVVLASRGEQGVDMGEIQAEQLLMAALQWHQTLGTLALLGKAAVEQLPDCIFSSRQQQQQQGMQGVALGVTGHPSEAAAAAGGGSGCPHVPGLMGLTVSQALAVAAGNGGGVLTMLLLQNLALLFLHTAAEAAAQAQGSSEDHAPAAAARQGTIPVHMALCVLQNLIAGDRSSRGLIREAALHCLSALLAWSGAAGAEGVVVLESPWHNELVRDCVTRVCRTGAALQQMAAEQARVLNGSCTAGLDTAAGNAHGAAAAGVVGEEELLSQQWCSDVLFLMMALQVGASRQGREHNATKAAATGGHVRKAALGVDAGLGGSAKGGKAGPLGSSATGSKAGQQKASSRSSRGKGNEGSSSNISMLARQQLQHALEQEHVLRVLCWASAAAAGAGGGCIGATGAGDGMCSHTQGQWAGSGSNSSRSSCHNGVRAACHLAVSATASQLLLQMVDSGLLESCRAGVQQQLREQVQQQQREHQRGWAGVTDSGLECWQGGSERNQGGAEATYNLAAMGSMEVVKGVAMATMRPCMLLLLLLTESSEHDLAGRSADIRRVPLLPQWRLPQSIRNARCGRGGGSGVGNVGVGGAGLVWWSRLLLAEVDAAMSS